MAAGLRVTMGMVDSPLGPALQVEVKLGQRAARSLIAFVLGCMGVSSAALCDPRTSPLKITRLRQQLPYCSIDAAVTTPSALA